MQTTYYVKAVLLLCVALVFTRCSEEANSVEENVDFVFQLSTPDNPSSGGRVSSIGDVRSALITLTNSDGTEVVLNRKEIAVYQYGDSYVTGPVALKPSRYVVTEFMLVGEDQEVVYAAPVKGSPQAGTVSKPLPISFVASKNAVKEVEIQVSAINEHTPADFGYAAFNIHLMMSFQVSAMLADNNKAVLTDAILEILKSSDNGIDDITVHTQAITPKANKILFSGDDGDVYLLRISKSGYGTYSRKFTYNELKNELDGQPLAITFVPSINIAMQPYFYNNFYVQLHIGSTQDVTVDWGDGTRETGTGTFAHRYSTDSNYPVTISNQIDKVHTIRSSDFEGLIQGLDVNRAINLQTVDFRNTELPNLDFSANAKLRTLRFDEIYHMGNVVLPEVHSINMISLNEADIDVAVLDNIINSLYSNAYFNPEAYGGTLTFTNQNTDYLSLISETSFSLLEALQNTFGWNIDPNVPTEEPLDGE